MQQLEWLGLEKGEVSAARQRQPRLQENSTEAGLLAAIIRGIAGLVSEPARCVSEVVPFVTNRCSKSEMTIAAGRQYWSKYCAGFTLLATHAACQDVI